MNQNVRNVAIVFVLAALVVLVPGGGTGARVAITAVSLAFLATLGWFASVMYRQHRSELYGLGDSRRATLYVAIGVAALTLTATHRMWQTGSGQIAWFVLIIASAYAVVAVVVAARRY